MLGSITWPYGASGRQATVTSMQASGYKTYLFWISLPALRMSGYMPGVHSVLQLCLIFLCTCRVTTHASEDDEQTHAKRMISKSSRCS